MIKKATEQIQKNQKLRNPKTKITDEPNRYGWIDAVSSEFVGTKQNKEYYRIILETLWPVGHGIPGPHLSEDSIRFAVNEYRKLLPQFESKPYVPYKDVFRRMRELAGEEGVHGIIKEGSKFQLIDLSLWDKKTPRIKLNQNVWNEILDSYDHSCPVCLRSSPEVEFDQDHKVPRSRGGTNVKDNWQPLCRECNNLKSTLCRGCTLDCATCSWAYPEKFAPLNISSKNILEVRSLAKKLNQTPTTTANEILNKFFEK
jgi:hypothetical protein